MPELPEVETLVLELKETLADRQIRAVEVRNESFLESPRWQFEREVPGKKIVDFSRRGKFISLSLSGGGQLWFHLGMTGQLRLETDTALSLDRHVHLTLSFAGLGPRLIFRDPRRFGTAAFTRAGEENFLKRIARLGPEPKEWERDAFVASLRARRARIKSLLLNQNFVAGLGNIYADESLHRAGIHPLRRPHRVARERLIRLHEAMREVLDEAIRSGGSSIDDYLHLNGQKGKFQQFHRVYGRSGEACLTCGARIRSVRLSGRTSSFCPDCQR